VIKLKILVVDDMKLIRQNIKKYLKQKDIRVVGVGNGRQALKIFHKFIFNVVILDLDLPDMNGIDILKLIRLRDKTVNIWIITGLITKEYYDLAIKNGANHFIMKPINLGELKEKIIKIKEHI